MQMDIFIRQNRLKANKGSFRPFAAEICISQIKRCILSLNFEYFARHIAFKILFKVKKYRFEFRLYFGFNLILETENYE